MRALGAVTYVVRDYDEAIAWFTGALRFTLVQDLDMGDGKRWVLVSPGDAGGTRLLLAKAQGAEQEARIGDQIGGRVAFFLHTSDFDSDHRHMKSAGVEFEEEPRHEAYGTVAVFQDLYGNLWDLIQPST